MYIAIISIPERRDAKDAAKTTASHTLKCCCRTNPGARADLLRNWYAVSAQVNSGLRSVAFVGPPNINKGIDATARAVGVRNMRCTMGKHTVYGFVGR